MPRRSNNRSVSRIAFIRRLISGGVLLVFCLSLSRSFLLLPLDQLVCLAAQQESTSLSVSGHSHHDEGEHAAIPTDGGDVIQHCKDTPSGVTVTPIQPYSPMATASTPVPESSWANNWLENAAIFEPFLPPPSQPPRA